MTTHKEFWSFWFNTVGHIITHSKYHSTLYSNTTGKVQLGKIKLKGFSALLDNAEIFSFQL